MVLFSDLRDFSAVKLQQLLLRVLVLGEEKGREREAGRESGEGDSLHRKRSKLG